MLLINIYIFLPIVYKKGGRSVFQVEDITSLSIWQYFWGLRIFAFLWIFLRFQMLLKMRVDMMYFFFLILLFFLLKYPSWLYLFCRVRLFYFYIIIIIIISCPRRFVNQASTYLPLPDPSSGHTNVDFFSSDCSDSEVYLLGLWVVRKVCSMQFDLFFKFFWQLSQVCLRQGFYNLN